MFPILLSGGYRNKTHYSNIKVKGFCLNTEVLQIVNFEVMTELVHGWVKEGKEESRRVNLRTLQAKRNHENHGTYVLNDFSTLPFGYC